jgi:Xaa-Pro aminopeptidase
LNRDRARKLLTKNAVVVLNANDVLLHNANGSLGLVQNADLFYLTGIRQEETMLMLAPDA